MRVDPPDFAGCRSLLLRVRAAVLSGVDHRPPQDSVESEVSYIEGMLAVGGCLGDCEDVLADALAVELFLEELGDALMREREHVLDG